MSGILCTLTDYVRKRLWWWDPMKCKGAIYLRQKLGILITNGGNQVGADRG